MYDFHTKVDFGKLGTDFLVSCWPTLETRSGLEEDLIIPEDGARLEVKTDDKGDTSGNFFIERFADPDETKPGGPWQAREHGCDDYLYLFWTSKVLYWFAVEDLIKAFESRRRELWKYRRRTGDSFNEGRTWFVWGYAVPKWLLVSWLPQVPIIAMPPTPGPLIF